MTFARTLPIVALIWSVAGTSTAAADARHLSVDAGQSKSLSMCKGERGSVAIKRRGKRVDVVFSDVSCANLDIFASPRSSRVYRSYKLPGKTMPRSASFTLPRAVLRRGDRVKLRIRSNSGKHADYLYVDVAPPRREVRLGAYAPLPKCGGSLKVTRSESGARDQVNVVLRNVRRCNTFTIESNNGRRIAKTYKITNGRRGKRSASFTLSWDKVIDRGNWRFKDNNINIKVSRPGRTQDLLQVGFHAR